MDPFAPWRACLPAGGRSDSLAMCPEYKVVSYRIRKARKTHLREAGEVVAKA